MRSPDRQDLCSAGVAQCSCHPLLLTERSQDQHSHGRGTHPEVARKLQWPKAICWPFLQEMLSREFLGPLQESLGLLEGICIATKTHKMLIQVKPYLDQFLGFLCIIILFIVNTM